MEYKCIYLLLYYIACCTEVKIYCSLSFPSHRIAQRMHIARNLDASFAQPVTHLTHDLSSFCDKTNVLGSKTLPELALVGTYYAHLTQAFTVCYPAGEQEQTDPWRHSGGDESLDWLKNYTCSAMSQAPCRANVTGIALLASAGSQQPTSLHTSSEGPGSAFPARTCPLPAPQSHGIACTERPLKDHLVPTPIIFSQDTRTKGLSSTARDDPTFSTAGLCCEGKVKVYVLQLHLRENALISSPKSWMLHVGCVAVEHGIRF